MMLRYLIVAAAFAAGPAHALCIPAAEFREVLAGWGESVRFAGMSFHAGQPTPVYVAIRDDGNWTVFFVGDGSVACLLATGTDWSERPPLSRGDARASE